MVIPRKKRSRVFFYAGACLLAATALAVALFPFGGEAWRSVYRRLGLKTTPPQGLTLSVFDVGQGSAACLSGEGQICLIDCGGPEAGDTVADEVRALGGERVDLLLVTHPHSDHIGGLPALLGRLPVSQVALPDETPEDAADTAALEALEEACCEAGCKRHTVHEGDVFRVAGFTVEALFARAADEENDAGAIYLAAAEGRRILFPGDASRQAEWRLLAAGKDPACDVLIAGHHGSANATSAELLEAAKPTFAVFSCGADNTYGHPAVAALARLRRAGVTWFRTDVNGTVRIALPALTVMPRFGGAVS